MLHEEEELNNIVLAAYTSLRVKMMLASVSSRYLLVPLPISNLEKLKLDGFRYFVTQLSLQLFDFLLESF